MKVYSIHVHHSYAINDCVIAESMAEAEKLHHEAYPDCEIRSITELYDHIIIAKGGKE